MVFTKETIDRESSPWVGIKSGPFEMCFYAEGLLQYPDILPYLIQASEHHNSSSYILAVPRKLPFGGWLEHRRVTRIRSILRYTGNHHFSNRRLHLCQTRCSTKEKGQRSQRKWAL